MESVSLTNCLNTLFPEELLLEGWEIRVLVVVYVLDLIGVLELVGVLELLVLDITVVSLLANLTNTIGNIVSWNNSKYWKMMFVVSSV